MPDEKDPGREPEINAGPVNLADLVDDDVLDEEEPADEYEDELEVEEEEQEEKKGGALADLMDDIFADEAEEDDRLRAFGDLEHLTMIEVASEVEAVLEELRIRQGGHE